MSGIYERAYLHSPNSRASPLQQLQFEHNSWSLPAKADEETKAGRVKGEVEHRGKSTVIGTAIGHSEE